MDFCDWTRHVTTPKPDFPFFIRANLSRAAYNKNSTAKQCVIKTFQHRLLFILWESVGHNIYTSFNDFFLLVCFVKIKLLFN